jgi:hypothetical protein
MFDTVRTNYSVYVSTINQLIEQIQIKINLIVEYEFPSATASDGAAKLMGCDTYGRVDQCVLKAS